MDILQHQQKQQKGIMVVDDYMKINKPFFNEIEKSAIFISLFFTKAYTYTKNTTAFVSSASYRCHVMKKVEFYFLVTIFYAFKAL
jgi:hypothetical protein